MRDQGLDEAIRAVGGITELARRIGISQPSVSNWERIPAERVLSVEAATGVAAQRPAPGSLRRRSDTLPTRWMPRAPRNTRCWRRCWRARPMRNLLGRLARLRGDPSPLGMAHAALGEAAARLDVETVGREYFDLFVGLGRGELLPYASYYLTGFLYERPLARLRGDLKRLGIERADGQSEPEDNAAILCEIMAGLAGGTIEAPPEADREIFEKHIAPWMGRFFADLAISPTAQFYARVGALGQTFLDIETEAFKLPR